MQPSDAPEAWRLPSHHSFSLFQPMMNTALRITEQHWQQWLAAIRTAPRLTRIDCDASLLTISGFSKDMERGDLSIASVQELLPPETAFFIANHEDDRPFYDIKKLLVSSMLAAETLAACEFSVPLQLDDPLPDELSRIKKNAIFLRKLLLMPLASIYTVTLPVRCPAPFPKSQEASRAIQICQAADSQRIGISLQIFSGDFSQAPSPQELLSDVQPFLKSICFHFTPRYGDVLFDDEMAEWGSFLKQAAFRGCISFYPHVSEDDNLQDICQAVQQWSDFFTD